MWSRFFLRKWIGALQTRGSLLALSSPGLRAVTSPLHCAQNLSFEIMAANLPPMLQNTSHQLLDLVVVAGQNAEK